MINAVDDVDLERDRSLVLQAQGGDDSAFAALYARYFRRLVRFAGKRVGNPTEAEEIAQEAFTRAYRALPNFAGDRKFYPWLCVITARLCVDSLRREGRCQVGEVADEAMIDNGYERLEKEGEVAKVVQAMGRLSTRHREVLELRERQGWSYHHIAAHYAVSLGTVEALLWRARRALKREYEGLGAIALSIPGVRRLAAMWRNHNSGQAAVTASAFGTLAVLGMAAGIMGGSSMPGSTVAAAAPQAVHLRSTPVADSRPVQLVGISALSPSSAVAPQTAADPGSQLSQELVTLNPGDQVGQRINQEPVHEFVPVTGTGVGADPDLMRKQVGVVVAKLGKTLGK